MTPLVAALEAKAFHRANVSDANAAIELVRNDLGPGALSYELALPQVAVDAYLLTKALPKLVYFLDCRGCRLPDTGTLFVSLFTPGGLLFLEAGPMVELLGAAAGLSLAELVRRYGQNGAGDPPLLGT